MHWRESWRADPAGRRIADNHYNRQKVGADQFVPPGRCVVLVIHDRQIEDAALWITSWPFPAGVPHRLTTIEIEAPPYERYDELRFIDRRTLRRIIRQLRTALRPSKALDVARQLSARRS